MMAKDTVVINKISPHPSVRGAVIDNGSEIRVQRDTINRLIEQVNSLQDRVKVLEVIAGV